MDIVPKLVISVIGNWPDEHGLMADLRAVDEAYELDAGQLTNDKLSGRWEFELGEEDPFLQVEIGPSLGLKEDESINDQSRLVSLVMDAGSQAALRQAAAVACDLLRAGGLAVNIPSSGKTFGRQPWLDLMDAPGLDALHQAYVGVVDIELDESVISCGMQNFGLPDGWVPDALHAHREQTYALLQAFTLNLLLDHPLLWNEDTYSMAPGSRSYHVKLMPCTQFEEDDSLFNRYGYWVFSTP